MQGMPIGTGQWCPVKEVAAFRGGGGVFHGLHLHGYEHRRMQTVHLLQGPCSCNTQDPLFTSQSQYLLP